MKHCTLVRGIVNAKNNFRITEDEYLTLFANVALGIIELSVLVVCILRNSNLYAVIGRSYSIECVRNKIQKSVRHLIAHREISGTFH